MSNYSTTGFGVEFDTEENETNAFCKRYRASITQTKQEMVEMQEYAFSPAMQDLAAASAAYHERHPVVEVRMTNRSLDTLVADFKMLSQVRRFIEVTPNMMEEFSKYMMWERLKK